MEKCPTLMEAAVPRIPLTFSKKILNKRHLIARELYETEKTYVNNLQKTILSYLNPNEDVLPPLFLKMKVWRERQRDREREREREREKEEGRGRRKGTMVLVSTYFYYFKIIII